MSGTLSIQPNERVTFRIRHEDDSLIVVQKRSGLVTQPGIGHQHDTLLNGLFAHCGEMLQNLGAARDFGLVHRLDGETSGLLVVAKRGRAYDHLREQFAERSVRKFYWAISHKAPRDTEGVIKRPIEEVVKRNSRYTSTKTAKLVSSGKPAVTAYRVLDSNYNAALIEARPVTGRLHQVRVHLASIGCAVLGDAHYGPKSVNNASHRLALHSHRLCFTHPETGEAMDFRTSWPQDLKKILGRVGLARPDLADADGSPDEGSAHDGTHEVGGDPVGEQES
ncbi:MAG: 23S rRNA pseudouridine1911/1915/1917 synthase [Phycisphaerales bacterium]|jgi:23S rRNA pseudouridine1911/1915/1917 synthase